MAPNIPILCHLATQLSPGDIIAITLTTKTKTIKIVPSITLVSFWLEANQQQDELLSVSQDEVGEWDYVPTTHTTHSLVPRLLWNVNMCTWGEPAWYPSLPPQYYSRLFTLAHLQCLHFRAWEPGNEAILPTNFPSFWGSSHSYHSRCIGTGQTSGGGREGERGWEESRDAWMDGWGKKGPGDWTDIHTLLLFLCTLELAM